MHGIFVKAERPSTVLFDLDGTLVHSAPDLHGAANAMLAELGLPLLSLQTVISFIGNGVPKLVERIMRASPPPHDEARLGQMLDAFTRLYNAEPVKLTALYPGVLSRLDDLKARGVALGLCTNKPQAPAKQVLRLLGLSDYFSVVVGGDSLPVRKPDPAPLLKTFDALGEGPRLYVGDSAVDRETAVRAKVPFAFFSGGYGTQAMRDDPSLTRFDSFDDFSRIVDGALGVSPT